MADMMTYEMLDDINLTIEAAHITGATKAIAGYVNGKYANWPAIVAKYGRSGKYLLSIDVQGNPSAGGQCIDCEKGDVDPSNFDEIISWVKVTRANGIRAKDLRFYPKVYTSASNAEAIVGKLTGAGIPRNTFMLWTAHYGEGKHICGPGTCGLKVQADATQWTNSKDGVSLDASLCYGYFFAGPGDAVPTVAEAPVKPKLTTVAVKDMHAYPSYRGVTLTWAPVHGATDYDVQLLTEGREVDRGKPPVPKASFKVEADTDYIWRVAALPDGGWSGEAKFRTPVAPAPKPEVPVSPVETPRPETPVVIPTPVDTPVVVAPVALPQPTEEPADIADATKGVLVYIREELEAEIAAKFGLPAGTIVFIPHYVEGA